MQAVHALDICVRKCVRDRKRVCDCFMDHISLTQCFIAINYYNSLVRFIKCDSQQNVARVSFLLSHCQFEFISFNLALSISLHLSSLGVCTPSSLCLSLSLTLAQ